MPEPVSKVFTGARARFYLNGKLMAWATGVDGSEEITQEPVEVLDRLEPAEYAPVAYRVTLTARVFRVPAESLRALGLWPMRGTDSDTLRQNILTFPEMTALIEDPITGKTIAEFKRVKPQARNFAIAARGIVAYNVTFTAIYMDEYPEA
jgi:hypothetical protein